MKRLLDVLREECALTGTTEGCGEGECGACTVLVDGVAVNSCLVPTCQVDGARITTIEGLAQPELSTLQTAFLECGGAQCGICTPGMILAASVLPAAPSLAQIRQGLAGNLCRCTGYSKIYAAVQQALGSDGDGAGKKVKPKKIRADEKGTKDRKDKKGGKKK